MQIKSEHLSRYIIKLPILHFYQTFVAQVVNRLGKLFAGVLITRRNQHSKREGNSKDLFGQTEWL